MNIFDRLDILGNIEDKDQWYVPKQVWNIIDICYGVSILREFKKNDNESKLEDYYKRRANEIKKSKDGLHISNEYRVLYNSTYLGFTDGIDTRMFKDRNITSVFSLITERVNNNFEEVDKYKDIIENQIEKLYIQRKNQDKKNGNDNSTKIILNPVFVLYKVLILIYKYTGKYEITMNEFKLFVCFVDKYENIYKCVEYIISSRLLDKNYISKVSAKYKEIRSHIMLEQLDTINIENKTIKIVNGFEEKVLNKINKYEREVLPKLSRENMDLALYAEVNIFDYYKGVQHAKQ